MSKNVIHNFNISIKNSTDIKSSEHLTENFIKELAKVSNEMHQQKDIVQIWKEQQIQNAANANNPSALIKGGPTYSTAETSEKNAISVLDTSLVLEKKNPNVLIGITTLTANAPIGGGVADTTGRITTSSPTSVNITPPIFGVDNNTLNFSSGLTTQTYAGVVSQQTLTVPKNIQMNSNEPSIEIVKAEIKKILDVATATNNSVEIEYWRNISKAFEEGAIAQDFDGKPNDMLFTQMYAKLKQLNSFTIESQSFNWDIIRKKMIESIDTNILNGKISTESSIRWKNIRQQINNDTINVANLFEQYDELFLLLKEVEGLDALPISFTIITKTKIYPNLSADKYPAIGTEDVYVFLKQISKKDVDGSKVNNGAVKIKNSSATSFIVGESLEFFLDETFLKQKDEKENINWVVYKDAKKQGTDFINEGTSFTYNFDTAGTYKVEAYGVEAGANKKSTINKSGFVKLNIIAQEIQIKAPVNVGTFTRPFVEEKSFKVSLKNTLVKTLNPVKLYYQIDIINANNTIKISDEQELDALGIIKLAMPDLGTYKIRVASKDQYALIKEFKTSVIKNEVTGIGLAEKTSNDNVFLLGNQDSKITLEAKTFKINPTDEEKEDVKWIIYDSNYKPYLTPETVLFTNKKDPQKAYIHKRNSFTMPIPQKEGRYTVEAFSDRQKGAKAESVFKMEVKQPEITEACWTWSGGSKKMTSGFSGESNWIKAHIPYYGNQIVRIYFYLNTTKTNHFLDVKTNENGAIFQEIKFDSDFKKLIGFKDKKNAKIGFKLLGIQNSKPYPFKASTNYESDTVLSVTINKKILDVYFTYDGNRVQQQDEVPFGKKGAVVTIVAKTQNMVGEDIVLTAHKIGEKPTFSNKARVSTEGVATTRFLLMNLNKKLKKGASVKYYAGVEGFSTKHLTDKMMNMVVGEEENKYGIDIEYFFTKYKGENKENLKVLLNDMNEYYNAEKIIPRKEQVAYILATAYAETFNTFSPVIESYWVKDKKQREEYFYKYDPVLADTEERRKNAIARGNTKKGDGLKYCGRGYVQLTWKNNYKKVKEEFGVDVVTYPDKVLEPKLAVKIMIWGMNNGIFTGVGINRYINDSKTDYVSARKVINGVDRKNEIADKAKIFAKDLKIIKNTQSFIPKSLSTALEEMKIIADKHLPYQQEGNTGKSEGFRTSLNDVALSKMDCSEFVCRYLHKLGITEEVKWVTTASMTSEASFQKALGTDKIKFIGNSKDFEPEAGDIFVWRRNNGGHTGIVYKYDSTNELVTILEAIGKLGSNDEKTNEMNGGYTLANCTRTSVYKSKGEALFAHKGFIGYFRPKK